MNDQQAVAVPDWGISELTWQEAEFEKLLLWFGEKKEKIGAALKIVRKLKVSDAKSRDCATNYVAQMALQIKQIEEKRKTYLNPITIFTRQINTAFKDLTEPLGEAKADLSRVIVSYGIQEEKRIAEENAKRAAEEEKLRKERPTEVVSVKREAPPPKMEGGHTREKWKFEIIDETLLPREYLTADLQKIGKTARTEKDKANIPGVRVYNDPSVIGKI